MLSLVAVDYRSVFSEIAGSCVDPVVGSHRDAIYSIGFSSEIASSAYAVLVWPGNDVYVYYFITAVIFKMKLEAFRT